MDTREVLDRKMAYCLLRFTLGLSMLMHGLVRPPHLTAFADGMVNLFHDTLLPGIIVHPFALILVFRERAVGLLLLLGLWARWALLIGTPLIAEVGFILVTRDRFILPLFRSS
jgi:thiosulfate dehydrogenase [quinone] large subunit